MLFTIAVDGQSPGRSRGAKPDLSPANFVKSGILGVGVSTLSTTRLSEGARLKGEQLARWTYQPKSTPRYS
jgi:hypothetical protein